MSDSNGELNGHAVLTDEERDALEPAPANVVELVAACVRFVAQKYGVMPDGTPDTLSLLDQYTRDARSDVQYNPSTIELLQGAVGAYLGEVMRSTFGGTWFTEGDQAGWRLDGTNVFLTFNPIGMAREALLLEPAEGWHAHFDMDPADRADIAMRLTILGDVDEAEYYLPTTRFDMVETVVDALHARMRQRGEADVRFTSEDYRTK